MQTALNFRMQWRLWVFTVSSLPTAVRHPTSANVHPDLVRGLREKYSGVLVRSNGNSRESRSNFQARAPPAIAFPLATLSFVVSLFILSAPSLFSLVFMSILRIRNRRWNSFDGESREANGELESCTFYIASWKKTLCNRRISVFSSVIL